MTLELKVNKKTYLILLLTMIVEVEASVPKPSLVASLIPLKCSSESL